MRNRDTHLKNQTFPPSFPRLSFTNSAFFTPARDKGRMENVKTVHSVIHSLPPHILDPECGVRIFSSGTSACSCVGFSWVTLRASSPAWNSATQVCINFSCLALGVQTTPAGYLPNTRSGPKMLECQGMNLLPGPRLPLRMPSVKTRWRKNSVSYGKE